MSPVKRNPNDRNLLAEQKRKAENKPDTFTLSTGILVHLHPIDYVKINQITTSVEIPETPTYETRTARGRVEYYPLDAKVVEQSPEYKEVWQKHLLEKGAALQKQGKRSTRAIYLDGTTPEEEWYDAAWELKMRRLTYDLPKDDVERWLLYLETGIEDTEAAELVMAIVRLTTLPEEVIQAAEDTFRHTLRPDDGRDDLENAGANPQGDAAGAVA